MKCHFNSMARSTVQCVNKLIIRVKQHRCKQYIVINRAQSHVRLGGLQHTIIAALGGDIRKMDEWKAII